MIQRVRIRHYKAIQDSKSLTVPAFAVFIGNNGSGKSSVLEALQLLQEALLTDLNTACGRWGGLEQVRNNRASFQKAPKSQPGYQKEHPAVAIELTCRIGNQTYHYEVGFNASLNRDLYLVEYESLRVDKTAIFTARLRDNDGTSEVTYKLSSPEAIVLTEFTREEAATFASKADATSLTYHANRLFLSGVAFYMPDECRTFRNYLANWQFLALNAHTMGFPATQNRLTASIRLQPDGRNLAEFIRYLARDADRLNRLIDNMKFVLPYASDIQTQTTEDFDRKIQLKLYEEGQKAAIPGWLFSGGTLRILAILAVLASPDAPTVLFIDEVENGLDPRTVGLLVNEFRQKYLSKRMQIVVTTHSPYFLDLVPLESIIVSEKTSEGTFFHLPKDEESLAVWREKFSPGKLYTMGRLTR